MPVSPAAWTYQQAVAKIPRASSLLVEARARLKTNRVYNDWVSDSLLTDLDHISTYLDHISAMLESMERQQRYREAELRAGRHIEEELPGEFYISPLPPLPSPVESRLDPPPSP